ncbi:transmembrane protein 267 [Leptinotarsa decemlineata]|uniref:transmembrane protein 267 n=1 Tax=Leptinotarsa decemlineata TaxID=7539 RepID=UPI000C255047|nr:transmembrane protein 267 [Leptinotarsa decemlineata]
MIFLGNFTLSYYLTVLLAIVAVIGDYVVVHSNIHVYQAIFDNATHAVIGGLSWCIVYLKNKPENSLSAVLEIAACTVMSSFIDIDHFFAARSFQLKDAISLKNRPPLHCSTFPLSICVLMLLVSYILQSWNLERITLLILTAFLSHHTRDATRRGYWFFPYGSTPPIPYGLYIILTCCIPYLVLYLHDFVNITHKKIVHHSVIQYT